jgi:hypothetical protein
MMTNLPPLPKRIAEALQSKAELAQWSQLIGTLLQRLELSAVEKEKAEDAYSDLANSIARKIGLTRTDIEVIPQGSMRTQTTISPRGNAKFDLDVIIKILSGPLTTLKPDEMFKRFGPALTGNEQETGDPKPKRRCWRLDYPGQSFYFDVTPAIVDPLRSMGTLLKVRDPDTGWTPSNPEDFADWFCERAALRFPFQAIKVDRGIQAHGNVEPLPDGAIGLDDILRRSVQLMKLHRDNFYWSVDQRKDFAPISVIIVTLATHAYQHLHDTQATSFDSPLEVLLAVVERMPEHIERNGVAFRVENPRLPRENFADRWNTDNGVRYGEFLRWHKALVNDLEALLHQKRSGATEDRIRKVFGGVGVDAWKASRPTSGILAGLVASAPGQQRTNPTQPTGVGSRNSAG